MSDCAHGGDHCSDSSHCSSSSWDVPVDEPTHTTGRMVMGFVGMAVWATVSIWLTQGDAWILLVITVPLLVRSASRTYDAWRSA